MYLSLNFGIVFYSKSPLDLAALMTSFEVYRLLLKIYSLYFEWYPLLKTSVFSGYRVKKKSTYLWSARSKSTVYRKI